MSLRLSGLVHMVPTAFSASQELVQLCCRGLGLLFGNSGISYRLASMDLTGRAPIVGPQFSTMPKMLYPEVAYQYYHLLGPGDSGQLSLGCL